MLVATQRDGVHGLALALYDLPVPVDVLRHIKFVPPGQVSKVKVGLCARIRDLSQLMSERTFIRVEGVVVVVLRFSKNGRTFFCGHAARWHPRSCIGIVRSTSRCTASHHIRAPPGQVSKEGLQPLDELKKYPTHLANS